MEKYTVLAVVIGVVLAIGAAGVATRPPAENQAAPVSSVPGELQSVIDTRYAGLPTEPRGFAPHGWICVVEPPPHWNPDGAGVAYPICPRPDWYPYDKFLGPPAPVVAVEIDPDGYMFATAEGVRVHRDGWVVTADGRAFRAAEKIDDMRFPEGPVSPSTKPADRSL